MTFLLFKEEGKEEEEEEMCSGFRVAFNFERKSKSYLSYQPRFEEMTVIFYEVKAEIRHFSFFFVPCPL